MHTQITIEIAVNMHYHNDFKNQGTQALKMKIKNKHIDCQSYHNLLSTFFIHISQSTQVVVCHTNVQLEVKILSKVL